MKIFIPEYSDKFIKGECSRDMTFMDNKNHYDRKISGPMIWIILKRK